MIYSSLGGDFEGTPAELAQTASPQALSLIDQAFDGFDEEDVIGDYHVHMISSDIDPRWVSRWHPFLRVRTMVYLSGAGIEPDSRARGDSGGGSIGRDHIRRIVEQVRHFPRPIKLYLYALDRSYFPDGTVDRRHTGIYVDNESVYDAHVQHPDVFVPVISIHPFRHDALDELRRWRGKGVRHIKWLPNVMGINPASPDLDAFYRAMIELDMVLLSHTGDERALDGIDDELGNPLHLRRPLEMGLKVVALHAAADGRFIDYEDHRGPQLVSGFELLLRMLDEPRYEGLLFGETAAMTFFTHVEGAFKSLLARPDLHHRFVNGSDYPLSAMNISIWTGDLERRGFISAAERDALDEIYAFNPLLFEFVLKRTVRHPQTGQRLNPELFIVPPELR